MLIAIRPDKTRLFLPNKPNIVIVVILHQTYHYRKFGCSLIKLLGKIGRCWCSSGWFPVIPGLLLGLCFTVTYTTAGLVLRIPWLSITFRLNANTVSEGTEGAIKVGVAVLAPVSITGTPVGNCSIVPWVMGEFNTAYHTNINDEVKGYHFYRYKYSLLRDTIEIENILVEFYRHHRTNEKHGLK